MADAQGCSVTRWTRHGKDLAYVTAGDGTRLGYLDLETRETHLAVPARSDEFHQALTHAGFTSAASQAAVDGELEESWHDLAQNRPGQAARDQAERALAEQRSRTRIGSAITRAFDIKTEERAWRKGAEGGRGHR